MKDVFSERHCYKCHSMKAEDGGKCIVDSQLRRRWVCSTCLARKNIPGFKPLLKKQAGFVEWDEFLVAMCLLVVLVVLYEVIKFVAGT